LMNGYPIGYAFECFNERYAEISTELNSVLEDVQFGLTIEPLEMASKWTANNDSKNYVVLGDPAVRMMVAENAGAVLAERPSILISTSPASNGNTVDFTTPVQEEPPAKKTEPAVETTVVETTAPVPFNINEAPPAVVAQTGPPQEVLKKLVTFLGQAIDSAATLDVRTYTSDQVDKVNLNVAGKLEGANLRALTVIKILGDIEQVVPVEDGQVNHELWEIHQETVRQAQASRNDLIRAAMSAAASLANLRTNR
jgi:hypothetical protein